MMIDNSTLKSWIPYKLKANANRTDCYWLDTLNEPYSEPFFDGTIAKLKSLPRRNSNYESVSSLAAMGEWSAVITDFIEPTALIFHVSRCGSTLISQLLCTDEQNIVLAEVPFFDDILRLPLQNSEVSLKDANALLAASVKYYGQKRTGAEQYLFIKTDSWHISFYKELRALYPATPFILLYRNPVEVFNSHIKLRGIHAVPGLIEPHLFGLQQNELARLTLDGYLIQVLEHYFKLYLEIAEKDENAHLINYNQGILPITDSLAKITDMQFTPNQMEKMAIRANYHSKDPGKKFSEEKVDEIPAVFEKVMELYQQTENKRLTILI